MQIVRRGFGAVVLDERETAGAEDVVVTALHTPVEVGQSELVIVHGAIPNTERGPGRESALLQVAAQHLRGERTGHRAAERVREEEHFQNSAVEDS